MLNKAFYDLHIHSCLSPCADNEMTPNNIAGMASIKGLNIVALTDHNTCGNCPAFFTACENFGITPIAGAEVTTSEDIHVVTLFDSLEGAMAFGALLDKKRVLYRNEAEVFGRQIYMDGLDRVIGEEEYLLINAVDISIDDIFNIAKSYNGIAYPAHIDKSSNSIVSVFGTIPDYEFTAYEFADIKKADEYTQLFPRIEGKVFVTSSDSHYLWDISERINSLEIFSDLADTNKVRQEVFSILRRS